MFWPNLNFFLTATKMWNFIEIEYKFWTLGIDQCVCLFVWIACYEAIIENMIQNILLRNIWTIGIILIFDLPRKNIIPVHAKAVTSITLTVTSCICQFHYLQLTTVARRAGVGQLPGPGCRSLAPGRSLCSLDTKSDVIWLQYAPCQHLAVPRSVPLMGPTRAVADPPDGTDFQLMENGDGMKGVTV